jgi:hypothetical protein
LTRAVTIIALTCFLIVGAAATSILGRDSLPAARPEMAALVTQNPVSNKEGKKDKLAVTALALASLEPAQQPVQFSEQLRQAFAAQTPVETVPPQVAAPEVTAPAAMPQAPLTPAPKLEAPKLAARPAPQKSYALLSDAQIAGIKQRLALSPDQEYYWPAVESALRAVAHKIHATRQADPHAASVPIDPDSAEVQQLKSAAMPLLFQLREDQKREVRSLARLIGLEKVAEQI